MQPHHRTLHFDERLCGLDWLVVIMGHHEGTLHQQLADFPGRKHLQKTNQEAVGRGKQTDSAAARTLLLKVICGC